MISEVLSLAASWSNSTRVPIALSKISRPSTILWLHGRKIMSLCTGVIIVSLNAGCSMEIIPSMVSQSCLSDPAMDYWKTSMLSGRLTEIFRPGLPITLSFAAVAPATISVGTRGGDCPHPMDWCGPESRVPKHSGLRTLITTISVIPITRYGARLALTWSRFHRSIFKHVVPL